MKAILVIDMPNKCWECPMHIESWDDDFEEIMRCNATKLESHYGEVPSWCPLKPMPKKKIHIAKYNIWKECSKEDKEIMLENKGWNACVDYILGEE